MSEGNYLVKININLTWIKVFAFCVKTSKIESGVISGFLVAFFNGIEIKLVEDN